jgi:hypothetical protein
MFPSDMVYVSLLTETIVAYQSIDEKIPLGKSPSQEQSMPSDNTAVYKFLQAVKLAMRASKDVCQVKSL